MAEEGKKSGIEDGKETGNSDDRIALRLIEDEMKQSYVDYAMSVIIGRALPDVRDGLKPVHRRILFAMNEMGITYNKPFRKCARIVGETLGKFHPHGDSAVYDALVRMAQDFSLRYPLVQGQGNFGSVDGDSAAAMRYTEARLAKISQELLTDINKETVNFEDNFDGSLKEPTVLPGKLPNLLVNGSAGIAVGMATNIPPHNLPEVCDAIIQVIDNPELTPREVVELLPGPDFPTGGVIMGKMGVRAAYNTGYGKIKLRAKADVEEGKKDAIIVTEIPYMVNKSMLIEEIAQKVKDKVITGISDLRDESDREGMRIVIFLKKDANKDIVLNQLFKHTRLQTTYSINLLALSEGKPKVMNLREVIDKYISHRREVVRRRTGFDLRKAEERAHILEGLIIALDNIDDVVAFIKKSKSVQAALDGLMTGYSLTKMQAQAILDMRLQKLTALEQDKMRDEHKSLLELIKELKEILASEKRILEIIKQELTELRENYSDSRKTKILDIEDEDIDIEDLIEEEEVVVTISHTGYIKRTSLDLYREQRRGGKGIIATTTKEEDIVEHLFIANTHDYILFFTDDGKVHWLKVYKIPDAGRYSAGKFMVNLLDLPKENKITAYIRIKEFDDNHYLVMGTRKGVVKKTELSAYSRPRAGGIKAITLDEGDELVNVAMTDGEKQIFLATKQGRAVKFKEIDARPIGRTSRGVRGISLRKGDEVVSMVIVEDDKTVLTITENGFGKRTQVSNYRLINRGGKGVINIICSERNGKVVDVKSVTDEDQLMFITRKGIVIRTAAKGISVIGRNTQGLRLMKLSGDDKVVAAAKVVSGANGEDKETEDKPEKKAAGKETEEKAPEEEVAAETRDSEKTSEKQDEGKGAAKEEEDQKESPVAVVEVKARTENAKSLEREEKKKEAKEKTKDAEQKGGSREQENIQRIAEGIVNKQKPSEEKIRQAKEQLKSMGIVDLSGDEE